MRHPSAAVVIPVYKRELSENELISLQQCFSVLGNYQFIIVHPRSLDLTVYRHYVASQKNVRFNAFEDHYFASISGYNKLMTSASFYDSYIEFEFILIYQLDCFVFRDELSEWCARDFDYIGAPWVNTNVYDWVVNQSIYPRELQLFHKITRGRFLKYVGNGGLSLRKVKPFIKNLRLFSSAASSWKAFEDSFFSHYVGTFNPFFKIAPLNVALKFSFDVHAKDAYTLSAGHLPFGCHGWYRNDFPHYTGNSVFWAPIISRSLALRVDG